MQKELTNKNYLMMFIIEDNNNIYYEDKNSVKKNYCRVNNIFKEMGLRLNNYDYIQGINSLINSNSIGNTSKLKMSSSDNFNYRLLKLAEDRRFNSLKIEELENGWVCADKCFNDLGIINHINKTSIYLTYHFKTLTLVHNSGLQHLLKNIEDILDGYVLAFKKIEQSGLNFQNTLFYTITNISDIVSGWTEYKWWNFNNKKYIQLNYVGLEVDNLLNYRSPYFQIRPRQFKGKGTLYQSATGNIDEFIKFDLVTNESNIIKLNSGVLLAHEIGHTIDFHFINISPRFKTISSSNAWLKIWGWKINEKNKYPTKFRTEYSSEEHEPPISLYGCASPKEDFAETYSTYIMNENFLKEYFPKRYHFIRNNIILSREDD